MTASEAREAAGFFRREVAIGEQMIAAPRHPLIDASEHGQGVTHITQVTAFKRAAAVALSAYADGIDAAAAPEFRATSSDTNRLHRIRARLLDLVPLDGTMSLADDVQRLDRALENAEARGRQHGLLAAAMLPVRPWWDHGLSFCGDCGAENASVAEFVDEIVALASEASDGR